MAAHRGRGGLGVGEDAGPAETPGLFVPDDKSSYARAREPAFGGRSVTMLAARTP